MRKILGIVSLLCSSIHAFSQQEYDPLNAIQKYIFEQNGMQASIYFPQFAQLTNERLEIIYTSSKSGPAIEMTDKAVLDNTISGTRITFKIPYKNLLFTYDQSGNH
jgi:hypothetical protein